MRRLPELSAAFRTLIAATCVGVCSASLGAQSPVVVRSTNAPVWGAAPKLMPEVRIGVIDGAEEYMFAGIEDVAVGKAGEIYVADGGSKPILRQYSASGKFERTIGAYGEGPGEYRSLGAIGTFADGRLAVWDNRIQRFTTFTADGKRIANARIPSGLFSSDLLQLSTEGDAFIKTVIRVDPLTRAFAYGWIHVSRELRVADTILAPKSPDVGGFVLATPAGFDKPFTPEVVSTMTSRGELLTGSNDRYAFELRRPSAPVVRIERSFTPVTVSGAEHSEWTAWAQHTATIARDERKKNGLPLAAFVVPRTKPAFKELRTDSDGRVWVRRYVAAVSHPGPERARGDTRPRRVWREPATYDVFERDGRLLGTLTLPWDATFMDAVGLKVYLVVTGPDGDESVQRFRVEPGR